MVRKMFILFLLLLPAVCVFSQQDDKDERKKREASLMKDIEAEHGPIHFVGKVIDQNGDPVADAEVEYFYNYFCLGHEYFYCEKRERVRTDKNGVFEIKAAKARLLNIDKVLKDGYDSGYEGKSFEGEKIYGISSPSFNCRDEKTGLAVFKVRKKGQPTLLLTSGDDRKLQFDKGDKAERTYALSLPGYWESGVGDEPVEKIKKKGYAANLIVTARLDNGSYLVQIKALGEKGAGIIVIDDLLYSAPTEGYKDVYEMEINGSEQQRKTIYVYAKTGSPLVYSRLEIHVSVTNTGLLLLYDNSRTNVYGEKDLEGGEYMYYSEKYNALKQEAEQALKEGKYPPKPDFKALEEEGKKEYLKTHKDTQ